MNIKYFFLSCFLFIYLNVNAEKSFRIQNLTTKDGLSQNTISCILQDKQGFLWFGSLNGLNKYDGNEFTALQPSYGQTTTLSDSRIKNIREDKFGYLWVQTNIDHINCYNPQSESFISLNSANNQYANIYFAQSGDVWLWGNKNDCLKLTHTPKGLESKSFGNNSLGSGTVNFISEVKSGEIWIGTHNKLFCFKDKQLKLLIKNSNFHSIVENGAFVYVFTDNNKMYKIDKESHKITNEVKLHFPIHSSLHNTALLSLNNILITTHEESYVLNTQTLQIHLANSLFKGQSLKNAFTQMDNKNHIWVYNKSGVIWQYNSEQHSFKPFELIPPSIISNIDMERYSIYHDSKDMIWISTYGNGLFVIQQKNNEIFHLKHHKNEFDGLRTNFLLSITEDRSGNIWLGTEYAGISKINLIENKYQSFYPEHRSSSDEDNIVRLIYEDKNENVWLGTKSGQLYIYDKFFSLIAKHQIKGGMPYILAVDTKGNKWIGTKGNGLLIFDNNCFTSYKTYKKELINLDLQADKIYAVCKDSKGRMWLGTFGFGLLLAKEHDGTLELINFPELRKKQTRIRTIVQDKNGQMWLGGNNGLLTFDPDSILQDKSKFSHYQFNNRDDASLSNNEVKTIFEDSKGTLWIGTSGGGLNKIIKRENKHLHFEHFTTKQGLVNDIIQGIQEDENQNLWISTESGISLFFPQENHFENYSLSSKWEGDLFCESAICKSKNGAIYLGSYDGFYTIQPDSIKNHSNSEPIILTELFINGAKILPEGKTSPLSQSISSTKEINLKHNQHSFTIQFAILNYQNTNRYTYILDGFETQWNPSTQHNQATYRNIPPGTYTFRVKGSNHMGTWGENETKLLITIEQPIWRSTKAIILYFILVIVIGVIALKINRKIYHLNAAIQFEHQLSEYKIRFITNISHEFRTPLTIIRSTIENLMAQKDMTESIKKHLQYLDKSSRRLLRLTNQFLEYRKIQNEQAKVECEPTEVVGFFEDLFSTFEELAERKMLSFDFVSNLSSFVMQLDKEKMEKVAYNLLSNAFKFVNRKGKISFILNINQELKTLSISVSDNGKGVPKKEQGLLFTRFKQISPSKPGIGIGLNLSYEIIKLHDGNIQYTETPGGGATFIASIPILTNTETKVIRHQQQVLQPTNPEIIELESNPLTTLSEKELEQYKNFKVLVIEDDPDVSDYLNDFLQQYFKVIVAVNGLDGINKCSLVNPQLIICDAMMPKMNGFQVIKRIKSDFQTCHIPIVMLTAYVSSPYQLKGITAGADAYITKPFSSQYLIIRMVKLLEQRHTLQQKYAMEPGVSSLPNFAVNKDNEFIKELNLIIKQNISNTDFSINEFHEKMSMGRTIFYKKVKGLTGFTPNDYIRVIRMKEAAKLLITTKLNVSEVAYKVGSSNPFYFSKCFKQQFGVSPSVYIKNGSAKS
ncbi:response regulator [Labilibaculum sp. A4]|uniref:hybrid sensor histidine kinase/response regulator n=1 Tax=Labilibaculum euxinus TaxID=2686357 RepID=UPI000F61D72C|nr:two-component regulator propeller domain-containing protein [Labilibaculum euxinus]MDQ1771042.1 two-component regulator propeller domain-containing protein [Labilibaculum euxinus]MWN76948.1 response regulator [Labilibaculum euxinus]